jgi:transcriptional regulator with XRE-family HTH domain
VDELTIGKRVARARHRAGMTQRQLADALGYSTSWVSQVERDDMRVDRVSVLDRLAEVLHVEITELTGQPYRHTTAALDSGHAGIPALRIELQRASRPAYAAPERAARPYAELAADVATAEQLRQAADFTAVGAILPALLGDVTAAYRAAAGGGDRLALLVVRTAHIARVCADLTGHHDLAWLACDLELRTAEALGAPGALAAATWDLCGVWLHEGAEARREARAAALLGINRLAANVGTDPELTEMWGALHLRAAVASSRLWDERAVNEHLAEAARVAPASGNRWQTMFNAANVALHALETAVELGRPVDALGLAQRVPVAGLNSQERITHYWTVRARSLGMAGGRDAEALEALLTAERLAPAHVHNRPMARELVSDLLHRGRRANPDLAAFARRMGLG